MTARAITGGGPAWAFNPDLVCANGFTQSCINTEFDSTAFDMPHLPSNGSTFAAQTYRTFLGFPLTAGDFWSAAGSPSGTVKMNLTAGSTSAMINTGTASVGDVVSNQSGGSSLAPYTTIVSIGGSVTAVNASGNIVLSQNALATTSNETVNVQTYNMALGTNYGGANLIRDVTITDGTNAQTTLKLFGTHDRALDTSNATLNYVLVANVGQKLCLSGIDDCMADLGSHVVGFTSNGGSPFRLLGATNGVNGTSITSAANGFGPIVKPFSTDGETNLPLNLQGLGASPVQISPGLTITGPLNVTGTASFGTYTSGIATPTGYITIVDAGGTTRHLAVVP